MGFLLSDIFIGNYPVIQEFGSRPEIYSARYSIKGHNGRDWGCPSLTMVLAAADGVVFETGFDAAAYGNFIKILHDGYLTKYGHLNDITVKKGDKVKAGNLIGHSNNTGFSDTPHLHFGIAPCDQNGEKILKDNGYGGYINPIGEECEWKIKNLTEPYVEQISVTPQILVDPEELSLKSVQANNFKSVATFAIQNGINDFLAENGGPAISIDTIDESAGSKINAWIGWMFQNENRQILAPDVKPNIPKISFKKRIKDFIFIKEGGE